MSLGTDTGKYSRTKFVLGVTLRALKVLTMSYYVDFEFNLLGGNEVKIHNEINYI